MITLAEQAVMGKGGDICHRGTCGDKLSVMWSGDVWDRSPVTEKGTCHLPQENVWGPVARHRKRGCHPPQALAQGDVWGHVARHGERRRVGKCGHGEGGVTPVTGGLVCATCDQWENGKSISSLDTSPASIAQGTKTDSDLVRPPGGDRPAAQRASPGPRCYHSERYMPLA